jgi:diguanylate cyclase (GGDEF)-like protein/PAS domain S-box-containing protein
MDTPLNLLFIEKSPVEAHVVQALLQKSALKHLNITHATSLSMSIDMLNTRPFDIILLVLESPDSQPVDTFEEIKKNAANTPIIILTELSNEAVAIKAVREGAQNYFIKGTFDGNRLARSISGSIEKKQNENTLYEYANIIENANEAIFSLTNGGIIKHWNHAAEAIYHYSKNELIDQPFSRLVPADDQDLLMHILNMIKSGESITQYEINLLDKYDNKIISLINVSPIKTKGGAITGITIFAQDLTERKQMEQLSAIQLRVEAALTEPAGLHEAPFNILKTICEILEFQIGEIWLIDSAEKALRCVSVWKKLSVTTSLSLATNQTIFHYNEGIPGAIWANKQSVWISSLKNDDVHTNKESLIKMGVNCSFGFPIMFNDEVLGVLIFFGQNLEQPDIRFKILFEVIGKRIGALFKRLHLETELLYLTRHDKLTGLANRYVTESVLNNALKQAEIKKTMVAFLYIDLDHFQNINDTLGYEKGDLLLLEVTQRLKKLARDIDLVARFGSDEFAIVVPDIKNKKKIDSFARDILNTIALPFLIDKKEFFLTASIGISIYPDDGLDVNSLMRAADLTMHQSKQTNINRYQYSSPELGEIEYKKTIMEAKLHRALQNNEFILYYQPIVTIQTNKITGVEALIRWKTSDGTIIPPMEFIPLLEHSGLIIPVGEWVLQTACKQIKEWQQLGLQTVAVNISVRQLNTQLVKNIKNILDETGLASNNLIIEVTESMLMAETKEILNNINALNIMGVRISIDDFGTGYSSFSYLNRLNINILKIDKSFISDVHKNKNSGAIVNAIILMAHALNIKTIAEGVETKKSLSFLKDKGCDEYQGYYFSKPLPPDELIKLLQRQES